MMQTHKSTGIYTCEEAELSTMDQLPLTSSEARKRKKLFVRPGHIMCPSTNGGHQLSTLLAVERFERRLVLLRQRWDVGTPPTFTYHRDYTTRASAALHPPYSKPGPKLYC